MFSYLFVCLHFHLYQFVEAYMYTKACAWIAKDDLRRGMAKYMNDLVCTHGITA